MNLSSLRPANGTSAEQLAQLARVGGWTSVLPEFLSQPLLLALARDARCIENNDLESPTRSKSFAALFYLITTVHWQSSQHVQRSGLEFSWPQMQTAIHIYQACIDCEIASRIVGLPSQSKSDLVNALHQCLASEAR